MTSTSFPTGIFVGAVGGAISAVMNTSKNPRMLRIVINCMDNLGRWSGLVSADPISLAVNCFFLEAASGAAIGAAGGYMIENLAKTIL